MLQVTTYKECVLEDDIIDDIQKEADIFIGRRRSVIFYESILHEIQSSCAVVLYISLQRVNVLLLGGVQ